LELASKLVKIKRPSGTCVAQLVECPTLGFGWGHDLRVVGLRPKSGAALSGESARDSLSPSRSASPPTPHLCSLSLK